MKRYLNLRLLFGLFLVLSLILAHPFAVFADVNHLMINTDSNALMTLELDDSDYSSMTRSSIASINNSINPSGCLIDMKNGDVTVGKAYMDSDGDFSYIVPAGSVVDRMVVFLYPTNMPSPGTYRNRIDFSSDTSLDYSFASLTSRWSGNNVQSEISTVNLYPYFSQNSGDFYIDFNLGVTGKLDYFCYNILFDDVLAGGAIGGRLKINFARTNDEADVSTSSIVSSGNDYQSDVSSSLSDLSSSVDSMTEDLSSAAENLEYISTSQNLIIQGIDNVVMHISDQLFAFWNQLFNLIHVPTMAKMDDIISAIQNMDLEIEVNLDGLKQSIQQASQNEIANDNKISADQIANDEANTEEVKEAVKEHGNFIIDGLKGLFIPSDEFFKAYFDDLYAYFSDRFGFLSFPIDLLIRTVNLFINSSDVDAVLTLPSFEISGEQVWADQSFNFTEFMETNFAFLLAAIRTVTSIGMIYAFVNLCQDKWDEVMKN